MFRRFTDRRLTRRGVVPIRRIQWTQPAGASRGLGMNGPGGQEILLVCLSRATGEEVWRKQYDQGNEIKMKQNMSSPTPSITTHS